MYNKADKTDLGPGLVAIAHPKAHSRADGTEWRELGVGRGSPLLDHPPLLENPVRGGPTQGEEEPSQSTHSLAAPF